MAAADIFIYGDIAGYQGKDASDFGVVSLRTVVEQIQSAKDADTLNVHIHSNGGEVDEGFAIHDALVNSGKTVNTIVDGNCYSIATVIFLAGSTRRMSSNAQFMIHNPWGMTIGTGEEIAKYADGVKAAEQRILDFYVQKTGGDSEQIKSMMDAETFMSASEAVELKFATDIIESVKAFAKIKTQTKEDTMSEVNKKANSLIENFKNSLNALFGANPVKAEGEEEIKAAMVQTDAGELNIDMAGEKVAVGDTVTTSDGAPYNGTATLENGTTITCEEGKVTSVSEKAPEESETEKALKNQVAELTAKITEQEGSISELSAALTEATETLKAAKKITSKELNIQPAQPALNKAEEVKTEESVEDVKAKMQERQNKLKATKK